MNCSAAWRLEGKKAIIEKPGGDLILLQQAGRLFGKDEGDYDAMTFGLILFCTVFNIPIERDLILYVHSYNQGYRFAAVDR